MSPDKFYNHLLKSFNYEPTLRQNTALHKLSEFIIEEEEDTLFLLKGYAGTGKTTIIGTLVKNLYRLKKKKALIAPTGRAAKVMAKYSGIPAQTIHKKIYFPKKKQGGAVDFTLKKNKHRDTVFIVDEASMIPDSNKGIKAFDKSSLLDDLMEFVFSGKDCQLILVGDTAQLPPVHSEISPALDKHTLEFNYDKKVIAIELDEVVRQKEDSAILHNATFLRENLKDELYDRFKFEISPAGDLVRLQDGMEVMNAIDESYGKDGHEETVIITRSNKRANLYNQQIRKRILFRENELSAGDFLMVVKNNYFWLKPNSKAGFIANGDIIEVMEIFAIKDLYGFRFAEVKIRMIDYPDMEPFETVLMLDVIEMNTPSLPYEDSNKLYKEVMKDYVDERSNYKKFLKVKSNPFFNALQVKFSYAITCHKSQGGQWKRVFVEQPYLPNGMDKEYLRWLYTACTRTEEKLYLLGFKDEFFV